VIKVECSRCIGGKGRIDAFSHIKAGVCFKCGGHGFVMQKSKPNPQKTYEISFLWLDKEDLNYNDGEFCHCWNKKYPSLNKANQAAEIAMKNNGSVDYKVNIKQ